MAARLRVATNDDWRSLSAMPVPPHWIGFACEADGEVCGFGGLYEAVDGRWWAMVQRRPGVRRPLAMMRAARAVLETAGAADVPVHALADRDIEGAQKFLDHLGFRKTGETIEGYEVHQWARR